MPLIMMDQSSTPESDNQSANVHIKQGLAEQQDTLTKEDGSNNNENDDAIKQSIYDVIGTNDQELARRQYVDDEADEFESTDEHQSPRISRHKRLATESNSTPKLIKVYNDNDHSPTANGGSNGRLKQTDDSNYLSSSQNTSTNGCQIEYNNYSNNGNSRISEESDISKARISSQEPQQLHSDEPEQMRKLFIGGLDYKTSEDALKLHFEKFGDVIDCVVMREPQSKRSRGFGFVIYANSFMVDRAQEARPHEVDGREVQSKRAISREDSGKPEAQATVKKVYLGGLSDDIEESELRDYFKEFGNIVNINIVAHKDTGKRRGFAFVEYDDYDPVDKIVLKKFHTIKDKRIEAKKAIPKVEMDARKRADPRAMTSAMIALSGPALDVPSGRPRAGRSGAACLWDVGPYSATSYPGGYSNQSSYGYPPHYHSPSAHYGATNWMVHGSQGPSPYGFRGSHGSPSGGGGGVYGRTSYSSQTSNWASEYGGFSAPHGGAGPMRLSYQHRSYGPYGAGYGAHRGRGYNP